MDNPGFAVTEEDDELDMSRQRRRHEKGSDSSDKSVHTPKILEVPAEFTEKSVNCDCDTSNKTNWRTESGSFDLARVLRALRHLTIEPIILLHMIALLISALILNDLTLDRACRVDLGYNETICDELAARNVSAENDDAETKVQQHVAWIQTWRYPIEYAVPFFLVLLLGSWSDVHGRKFPLMLPMFGHIIKVAGLILTLYFPSWNAVTVTLFVLVPTALTGSFPIFSMSYHSVLVDTTPKKYRTVRFGFANAFQTFGVSLGTVLGGNLFSKTSLNFLGVFIVSGAVEVVNIVLTALIIRNTKGESKFEEEDGKEIAPATTATTTTKDALKGMVNLTHLYDALKTTLRIRPNYGHLKLWILIVIFFCGAAPYYGESSVIYLFLRKKFMWGAGEYGFFGMYQTIAGGVGVLISMGLLSYWLSLEDCIVGLLGCISQISSCLMYAWATETTIYIAPLVDVLNGAMTVSARSMITKSVSTSEQGKILSFLAGMDSVNPVVTNIAYNSLYARTLDVLPGAFFLLSAGLAVLPMAVFASFTCMLLGRGKKGTKTPKSSSIDAEGT